MAQYKFDNFTTVLVDPTIESITPTYKIGDDKVQIYAVLNSDGNKLSGVYLGEMDNTNSWNDDDVSSFAENALENFKID